MKSPVTVVINTKNAEKTLERTLKSVQDFETIVIVDMESTDKTVSIAKKFTKKVYSYKDVGYVEPARNFAISKSPTDWVLIVDSDEEVPPNLIKKVQELSQGTSDNVCYFIPRKNIIFGKWIQKTGWWPDFQPRFFKKDSVTWLDEVHSVPKIMGSSEYLPVDEDLALIHHNYESVSDYLVRLDRYTTITASEANVETKISPVTLITSFSDELSRRLFKERGIEEGIHGVGLSFLQSMYQLVVELKNWELSKHKDTQQRVVDSIEATAYMRKNLAYWIANYKVDQSSGFVKIFWKVRRKLKI